MWDLEVYTEGEVYSVRVLRNDVEWVFINEINRDALTKIEDVLELLCVPHYIVYKD